MLCQSFTGLSGGVCPGGSATFTCVADATTITWIVTSEGMVDTCSYSQVTQADSCGPGDMFMSSQTENGGTNSSTLSVESVTDVLNGTIVTCSDGSTVIGNHTLCIISMYSDRIGVVFVCISVPLFQMCWGPLNSYQPVSVD